MRFFYALSIVTGILFIIVFFVLPMELFVGSTLFEKLVIKGLLTIILLLVSVGALIIARIENVKNLIEKKR